MVGWRGLIRRSHFRWYLWGGGMVGWRVGLEGWGGGGGLTAKARTAAGLMTTIVMVIAAGLMVLVSWSVAFVARGWLGVKSSPPPDPRVPTSQLGVFVKLFQDSVQHVHLAGVEMQGSVRALVSARAGVKIGWATRTHRSSASVGRPSLVRSDSCSFIHLSNGSLSARWCKLGPLMPFISTSNIHFSW